jgi:hypothetical protein
MKITEIREKTAAELETISLTIHKRSLKPARTLPV